MKVNKDKLLDIMRDNIKEKQTYIDDLLTENVQLKLIINKLKEKLKIEKSN